MTSAVTVDVERSEEEQSDIREKFPRLINMTPSEMREWGESPFAGQNRKSGEEASSARTALSDVIRLKEEQMADWTEKDYDDAVEAIAFVERMSNGAQGDPLVIEGREGPSARDASLKDWGHNPAKADQQSIADRLKADGRTLRTSYISLADALEPETIKLINRALEVGRKVQSRGDAVTMQAITTGLRTDGIEHLCTQEGFLLMPVLAARTGCQLYGDLHSTWNEYRSDEEVAASCPTYALRPFTDDHPDEFVTPYNYTDLAKGSCGQDATLTEVKPDKHRYVRVTVLVGDYDTLVKIKRGLEAEQAGGKANDEGKVELSAGYTTRAVDDPGVDPHGVAYQYRQTDIVINHLALVDRGRAGPRARFALNIDGAAWELEDLRPSAASKQDAHVTTKQDMLPSEEGLALLMAVRAYLYPETPEAQAEALNTISMMLSHPPEVVAEHLGAKVEPDGDMEEMEISDGITVKISADAKAKWESLQAKGKQAVDAAKSQMATMTGRIQALETVVDSFKQREADAKQREADAKLTKLRAEISDICPTLGEVWAKKGDDFKMTEVEMMEAAIVDLEPSHKTALDASRGDEGFASHIKGLYAGTIFGRSSKSTDGKKGKNVNTNTDGIKIGSLEGLRLVGDAAMNAAYGSSQ